MTVTKVETESGQIMYEWTAPSGVLVRSCKPYPPKEWQDYQALHIFWSYAQWAKKIRLAYKRPWKHN